MVDYERGKYLLNKGRTVLNWRPRRFGMGLGYTRMTQ